LLVLLREAGVKGQTSALESTEVDPEVTYIVLDCAERPLLVDPSQQLFDTTKNLFTNGKNTLWVSFQESDSPQVTASKGVITGMARVLRRENENARLVTFDVRDNVSTLSLAQLAKALMQVALSSFWRYNANDGSVDREYAYQNGLVSIARLRTDNNFNKWADSVTTNNNSSIEMCAYRDFTRPLKLEAETPGLLNSLRFVDDPKPAKTLGPGEILVEARAYGVNFKDVFVALGQMPPEVVMVGEFAGVVRAVGSDIKEMYQVGDRVAGATAEPFASYPRLNGLLCHKIPDRLSFVDGASAATVFYTAWYCLEYVARLRRDQSVLIHAASGGVGQAAIQLAQHIGTEIFVTVGSLAKRKLVMDKYNIPESHIFSTRSTTFKQGILRLTKNKGVDVILNSLSGEALASSWECIASFGTFLEIGKTDIYKRRNLHMDQFDKSVTFAAVDVALLGMERPEMIHSGLRHVFNMFAEGIFHPVHPVTTFPMSQVEDAFRLIATRKHTGKLVIIADDKTQVKAVPLKPLPLQLERNGTYVVAGGLGDLGKRICKLLAAKGAGHIVTLSRRTISEETLKSFKDEIEQLGSSLHILQCDIIDKASVLEAKLFCHEKLAQVKGVIHAGMVLRVSGCFDSR
jgi:NADPH:quinone reductase-like Zn-dependent oxidoreductase